jgi:hypothetical protein
MVPVNRQHIALSMLLYLFSFMDQTFSMVTIQ